MTTTANITTTSQRSTSNLNSSANNTTANNINYQPNRNNLATLQSGQESDFISIDGQSMTHDAMSSYPNTNNNNQYNLKAASSASSTSLSSSSSLSASNKLNAKQELAQSCMSSSLELQMNPMLDSKNLYYNHFLNKQQQKCLQQASTNPPQSPPVKLSSTSPTKQKYLAQQQQQQLSSSSTNSISAASSSTNPLYQKSSASLSRSNVNLNQNPMLAAYQHNFEQQQQQGYGFAPSQASFRKNMPSAISLENINAASSLNDAEHMPKSISPSPNFYNQSQQQQQQQAQFEPSKKPKRKKTQEVAKQAVQSASSRCSPIKASTLIRPNRQVHKLSILNILDGNQIVIEWIKEKKGQQHIIEVMKVSTESDTITIYKVNNGKGLPIGDKPPPMPADPDSVLTFSYKTLPEQYWKKYDFAAKFFKVVRSRTPKITLNTKLAKCTLMDTSPDFEVIFNQGTKFSITKEGSIKITHNDGTAITLDSNSRSACLSPEIQDMLDKVNKWHQYCLDEEKYRVQKHEALNDTDMILFPVIIGKRPPPMTKAMSVCESNMQSKVDSVHYKNSSSVSYKDEYTSNASNSNSMSSKSYSNSFTNSNGTNHNFELKSASTSSLATTINNTHDSRMYHQAYGSQSGDAEQQQQYASRMRKLTAYDSSASPSPLTIPNLNSNELGQMSSSHQLNSSGAKQYRPQSSSSSSSSYNQNSSSVHGISQQQSLNDYSCDKIQNSLSSYSTSNMLTSSQSQLYQSQMQYQAQAQQQQQQQAYQMSAKYNRQLTNPSPSMITSGMAQLGLMGNHQAYDNVPVSLPQRDGNYYN